MVGWTSSVVVVVVVAIPAEVCDEWPVAQEQPVDSECWLLIWVRAKSQEEEQQWSRPRPPCASNRQSRACCCDTSSITIITAITSPKDWILFFLQLGLLLAGELFGTSCCTAAKIDVKKVKLKLKLQS